MSGKKKAQTEDSPSRINIFMANCELVRISKYTGRYRMTVEDGSVPVDLDHIEIARGFLPKDKDFNMDFINMDLDAVKDATKKMKAKQKEFRKFMNLQMVIIKDA